jgi:hypothetical protein
MKNIIIISLLIIVGSCKKVVPKVNDFVAVKNSLRAMNEITTLAELVDFSLKKTVPNSWFSATDKTEIIFKITPSSTDLDTIIFDFKDSTFNLDQRIRRGRLIWSITDNFGSFSSVATLSFENYSCNNVKITGTLQMVQIPSLASDNVNNPISWQNQIIGDLTFTLFNGQKFNVQPVLSRNYLRAQNFYTGTLTGSDVNNENFSVSVLTELKKSEPYAQFEVPKSVFYNGQFQLTQGNKVGKVWYGYKDEVDTYGFVEWQNSKYNFFLADY